MNIRLYLLKISLSKIEPEIWRRFVVPASITLDRLHDVIQIVMGWTDSHLHEFTVGKKRYTENPRLEDDGAEENRYRLEDLIKRKGGTFQYLYDFGDYWVHEIIIEENVYFDPNLGDPLVCLEGERACPPEDVGGIPGYYEFCKAVSDPDHFEHQELTDWFSRLEGYDKVFKSEKYNMGKVNYELMKYLRWSRQRLTSWEEDF